MVQIWDDINPWVWTFFWVFTILFQQKLRVGYVYIEESFDTIFNIELKVQKEGEA